MIEYDREMVKDALDKLKEQLAGKVSKKDRNEYVIIGILEGGKYVASEIAGEFGIDLLYLKVSRNIDYVKMDMDKLKWILKAVEGKKVILIDDIYETGKTMEALAEVFNPYLIGVLVNKISYSKALVGWKVICGDVYDGKDYIRFWWEDEYGK